MPELRLYDRSRVTCDWRCERMRFYQYEWNGRGIVTSNTYLELYLGTLVHDGLAAIAHQHETGAVDIDAVADSARDQMVKSLLAQTSGEVEDLNFANEQGALVEGLLRGFYRHVWPRLMAQYPKILMIEQELIYNHDGLTFMVKPDLVLEDAEGSVWYIEFKSTSSKNEGWVEGWATAVQLHSSLRAIQAALGRPVTGVIVQGLYKGYISYNKQNSPFCYAYQRKGTPPFSKDETSYEYKAGFKRYPTWEMPGGVKAWVEGMPEDVLANQFPQTPPIFVKDHLLDAFFRQRAVREGEIESSVELLEGADEDYRKHILDATFPQKFDQCHPYFGKACAYLRLCHSDVPDPLTSGFQYRVPHHLPELEQQKELDASRL